MTKQYNAQIHALLGKVNLDAEEKKDYKKELVAQFSNGRETSTSNLTDLEAFHMIRFLQDKVKSPTPSPSPKERGIKQDFDHEYEVKNKMRGKLLAMGYDMKWNLPSGASQSASIFEDKKINAYHVERWCLSKHSIHHKSMNEMTVKELSDTVTQMEKVKVSFLKSVVK